MADVSSDDMKYHDMHTAQRKQAAVCLRPMFPRILAATWYKSYPTFRSGFTKLQGKSTSLVSNIGFNRAIRAKMHFASTLTLLLAPLSLAASSADEGVRV